MVSRSEKGQSLRDQNRYQKLAEKSQQILDCTFRYAILLNSMWSLIECVSQMQDRYGVKSICTVGEEKPRSQPFIFHAHTIPNVINLSFFIYIYFQAVYFYPFNSFMCRL